jgi:hypothetical protein
MVEIQSLTLVITPTLNPCFASISRTCKAMAFLEVFVVSNKLMVT